MEKSLDAKNNTVTDTANESNNTTDVKKTFHITKDVIEECLETFLG